MRSLLRLTILQFAYSFLLLGLTPGCILDTPPNDPASIVPALVGLLSDSDPGMRRNAVLALGRIEHPHAIEPLVDRLGDPDPAVREASAWGLGNIGEAALDQAGMAMVQRLGDPSNAVKVAVAQALAAMGAKGTMVEVLIETLQDRDVHVRRAAVLALWGVESKSAYATLVEAVGDQDPRVRQGAIAAIAELGETRAVPLFRDRLAEDTDVGVRSEAAYRLGKLGSPNEVASLGVVAVREESPVVRRWVRWAIDEVTPPADFDSGP